MEVEFKKSTNENFKCLEGIKGKLNIDLIFYFDFTPIEGIPFELRHGRMRSSVIKSYTSEEISRNCYEIKIITNNSEYIFINGIYDQNTPPLTEDERLALLRLMMF
jgi:hypothetical protein